MRRTSVLLPKVVTFQNDLIRYGNLLTEDRHQEAEQLCAEWNVQWGGLQSDLDELNIPRFWQLYGRTFPTFETALHPSNERHDSVMFDALRFAVVTLEPVSRHE